MDGFESASQYARYVVCFQQNFRQKFNQYGLSCIRPFGQHRLFPYARLDDVVAHLYGRKLRFAHKNEDSVCGIPHIQRAFIHCKLFILSRRARHRYARKNERRRYVPLDDDFDNLRLVACDFIFLDRSILCPFRRVRQIQRY